MKTIDFDTANGIRIKNLNPIYKIIRKPKTQNCSENSGSLGYYSHSQGYGLSLVECIMVQGITGSIWKSDTGYKRFY